MTTTQTTKQFEAMPSTPQERRSAIIRQTMVTGLMAANLIACAQPTATQTPTQQISACALTQTQKAQQTMKLEKVRDVKHLIQQIHDNLGNDILCADPEWLEQQWGVRIFGWRGKRGLPELERTMVDGKQVEPPPLVEVFVRWRSGLFAFQKITQTVLDVQFGAEQDIPGRSVVSLEAVEQIFGNPALETRREINPPPLMPGQVPQMPPFSRGIKPNRVLTWLKPNDIKAVATTRYASEIPGISFFQIHAEGK